MRVSNIMSALESEFKHTGKEEGMHYDMASDMDIGLAASEMVRRYGDGLLRLCFLYLKDAHLAEDAVQDTFFKVFRNYGSFEGRSDEKTWITRIAINVCKNYLRNPWRKHVDESTALESIPYDGGLDGGQDDIVVSEIMKLPAKYKDVILLYYYQDMSTREISGILNIPEATVSTRLGRARGKLKNELKGWYFDE